MRSDLGTGHAAPVDLALVRSDGGYEPLNSLVMTRIGPGAGVRFKRAGFSVSLEGSPAPGTELGAGVFYEDVRPSTDALTVPTPTGVETSLQLRANTSPEDFAYQFELGDADALRLPHGKHGPVELSRAGRVIAAVSPAVAHDARGHLVRTSYALEGSRLVVRVDHRSSRTTYPVLVDPVIDNFQLDGNGNRTAQGSETFPYWTTTTNAPAGWFAFGTGGGSGTGLYISSQSGSSFNYSDGHYGQWRYQAPGTSYIERADFGYVTHTPAGTCLMEGIAAANGSWLSGTWRESPQSGGLTGTSPWLSSQGSGNANACAAQSSNYKEHDVGSSAVPHNPVNDPIGTPGDQMVLGLLMSGAGTRSTSASVFMYGASIWLYDDDAPTITSVSQCCSLSRWYGYSDQLTVTASATDSGLGMKSLVIDSPPGGSLTNSCSGDHTLRCLGSLSGTLSYPTGTLADGPAVPVTLRAKDIVGNQSSTTWNLKIDHTNPNGSVTYTPLTDGYLFHVDATDGDASHPSSGVNNIQFQVDDEIDAAKQVDCPDSGNCTMSADWKFDYWDYPAGDHTITIVVQDQVANMAQIQYSVTVPGTAPLIPDEDTTLDESDAPSLAPLAPVGSHPPLPMDQAAYLTAKSNAESPVFALTLGSALSTLTTDSDASDVADTSTTKTRVLGSHNWEGLGATDDDPSDSTGGSGPGYYMEIVNGGVAAYRTSDDARVSFDNLRHFVRATYDDVFDPQMQYDTWSKRWLYVADRIRNNANNNPAGTYLAFGWSKTQDPSDFDNGWCHFFVSAGTTLEDYPKLGHNRKFMLVGTNRHTNFGDGQFQTARIWAIPKPGPGVSTCQKPRTFRFGSAANPLRTADNDLAETPVPANNYTSGLNGYVVAADDPATHNDNGTQVMLWRVNGKSNAPRLTSEGNLTVTGYAVPPAAPQTGTDRRIDTNDGRLTQAVANTDPNASGSPIAVWTQHTILGEGNRSAVRWYEIIPHDHNIRQNGVIADTQNWVFNGAVSPAPNGTDAAIFYNVSGPNRNPEIRARSRHGGTALNRMIGPLALATSDGADVNDTCYDDFPLPGSNICRWGDYAGASPDGDGHDDTVWGTSMVNGAPSGTDRVWRTRNYAVHPSP